MKASLVALLFAMALGSRPYVIPEGREGRQALLRTVKGIAEALKVMYETHFKDKAVVTSTALPSSEAIKYLFAQPAKNELPEMKEVNEYFANARKKIRGNKKPQDRDSGRRGTKRPRKDGDGLVNPSKRSRTSTFTHTSQVINSHGFYKPVERLFHKGPPNELRADELRANSIAIAKQGVGMIEPNFVTMQPEAFEKGEGDLKNEGTTTAGMDVDTKPNTVDEAGDRTQAENRDFAGNNEDDTLASFEKFHTDMGDWINDMPSASPAKANITPTGSSFEESRQDIKEWSDSLKEPKDVDMGGEIETEPGQTEGRKINASNSRPKKRKNTGAHGMVKFQQHKKKKGRAKLKKTS